jgi:methionyl-tRNA formyltransferase
MKITLFTANSRRHNYFINLLATISDELFVVQESRTIFPGLVKSERVSSKTMDNYFQKVSSAEQKIFGNNYINSKNVKIMPLRAGDLNNCKMKFLKDFLKSDFYIVFGSSYIKGELIDFLIKRKAVNIHMGVSPYYRGTDCNFWALYDENPHLVGATIHMLSKGLDSGSMLYHAMAHPKKNLFEYSMSTVKSAFHSLADRIKSKDIFKYKPEIQNKLKEIRYSKLQEFNDNVIKRFNKKKPNKKFNFKKDMLKNPYFLK